MEFPKVTKKYEKVKKFKRNKDGLEVPVELKEGAYLIETPQEIKEEKYWVEIEGDIRGKAYIKFENNVGEQSYKGEITREVLRREDSKDIVRINGFSEDLNGQRNNFDFEISVEYDQNDDSHLERFLDFFLRRK